MRLQNRREAASFLTLAVFLIAAAAPLSAERKLGTAEAVALAIANNEGLKQSALALEAKRRALGLAWNELLPSVTAGAGLTGSSVASGIDSSSVAIAGNVSASLNLSAAIGESKKLLRLAYEGELLAYEKAQARLELQVRKKAYSIVLDTESLKLARQNIERESASYVQTEERYKAGLASELELLSAKVTLETLKPVAEGYSNTLANDIDGLKNLIGLNADEEISIDSSLDLADDVIARVLGEAKTAKSPDNRDVAAAAKSLEKASSSKASLVRAKLWPSLALSASLVPSLPLSSSTGSAANSLTASASAMVSIPLDNYLAGSKARESIAEAQDGIDSSDIAYKAAIKDTEAARKSYIRSVESYRNSLAALKLNVDLAQRSYDASLKAYKNGLVTLTTLQSASGNLESAKLSALSKSYDLIAAILDLAYETGLPLDSIGRK
jgi:multidrug efflux system outer membrane protein